MVSAIQTIYALVCVITISTCLDIEKDGQILLKRNVLSIRKRYQISANRGSMASYRQQNYRNLLKSHRKQKKKFEDPYFPANSKSLFYSKVVSDVEWKRPKDLCKVPRLSLVSRDKIKCLDVVPGELGNVWFTAACGCLALHHDIWTKVIVNHIEQEYKMDESSFNVGIFHFLVWRVGVWYDVVVDDRLPYRHGNLLYCHSGAGNEYWPSLLEKAFAKLYGDYESLASCRCVDALVAVSGGVSQRFRLSELDVAWDFNRQCVFKELREALLDSAMITCAIDKQERQETHGLNATCGYAITKALMVNVPKDLRSTITQPENGTLVQRFNGSPTRPHSDISSSTGTFQLHLIRLRTTTLADCSKWIGNWSSNSPQWSRLSQIDRDQIGLVYEAENEFWMSLDDFVRLFNTLDICHRFYINPVYIDDNSWAVSRHVEEWTAGAKGTPRDRSGGADVNSETFLLNHQYIFDVGNSESLLVVSLEQDDFIEDRNMRISSHSIGIHIIKVESNREYRLHKLPVESLTTPLFVLSIKHESSRSVYRKIILKRGRYVLLPTTQDSGIECAFILRVFTKCLSKTKALTADVPSDLKYYCVRVPFILITQLNVIGPEAIHDLTGTDLFVKIECENKKVKSQRFKSNLSKWNFKVIFYRTIADDSRINIQLWQKKAVTSELLGMCCLKNGLDVCSTSEGITTRLEMKKKKKTSTFFNKSSISTEETIGFINVHVVSSEDIYDI